jgi:hypothetical protein
VKASLLFIACLALAISSITPAKADKSEDKWKCSVAAWPATSTAPCAKAPTGTTYADCVKWVMDKQGLRTTEAWYACSNMGLKD